MCIYGSWVKNTFHGVATWIADALGMPNYKRHGQRFIACSALHTEARARLLALTWANTISFTRLRIRTYSNLLFFNLLKCKIFRSIILFLPFALLLPGLIGAKSSRSTGMMSLQHMIWLSVVVPLYFPLCLFSFPSIICTFFRCKKNFG